MSGLSFAQLQAMGFADKNNTLALANKTLTSPVLTGNPTAPTPAVGDNDTSIATTAFVQREKEYLPAISQSLHIGTVVKAIVYDTSKDSDGGAWRKRCQDKSWYTETLGGDRWIGQQATIAAAWAAAGSVTGAVFQASATAGPITIGKYYAATSATTSTEVFRGISREFPAVAGIVAESGRVVIYDLNTGAMWMVFVVGSNNAIGGIAGNPSLAALNGILAVGNAGNALHEISFSADNTAYRQAGPSYIRTTNIGLRNTTGAANRTISPIIHSTVNDVAITVLENSPIDPATGLPVPTIAVATAGGVSVIKQDGKVVNSSQTEHTDSCAIVGSTLFLGNRYATSSQSRFQELVGISAGWTPTTGMGYLLGNGRHDQAFISAGSGYTYRRSIAGIQNLELTKLNKAAPNSSMRAAITNTYNTGWQVGDSRLATLADTVAETIVGATVASHTFDGTGSLDGLALAAGAVNNNGVGVLDATSGAGQINIASRTITGLIPGKTYSVRFERCSGTSTVDVHTTEMTALRSDVTGFVSRDFVAANTQTALVIVVGNENRMAVVDNISVKLAEPDRSVKAAGLVVNGTLTKAPVASGANLVAYSGFSAANYLEQPYNSQLDFGTGDFCVMGWCPVSQSSPSMVLELGKSTQLKMLSIFQVGGNLRFYINNAIVFTYVASFVGLNFITFARKSGVASVFINGVEIGSFANTANMTHTDLKLRLGESLDPVNSAPLTTGSLALWRISATAPSADQIAHIYRTELPLFQPNAKCTIDGTSPAVTALAYDDSTDLLHVGTSWGRTSFKDLLRVDSEATTTGSITSLSAQGGTILTGGTSVKLYVPAKYLRDELQRQSEAKVALGRIPVFTDYDAIAAQVAFVLPKGFTAKAVYSAGLLKRAGTTKDYLVSTDGFQETVTFAVAPGAAVQVSIMAVRSN